MPFTVEEHRVVYTAEDRELAFVTFPAFGEGVVNIDHTFVDPVLRLSLIHI